MRDLLFERLAAGVELSPLELFGEKLLATILGPLLDLHDLLLRLEVVGVVPLEDRDAAVLDLDHVVRDVVEEVSIVRHHDDGARVLVDEDLEPLDRRRVEVVGRLIENEQVGLRHELATQRDAPPFTTG